MKQNLSTVRLALVSLEDRQTPAVFVVSTILDSGVDAAPTTGSLRAAILNANATPGADTIQFNINGGGVQPLTILVPLPSLSDTVTIDGTTQPGFAGSPVIRLVGGGAGATANGLTLKEHTGSTIRGLTIGGFAGAGIRISGGGSHTIVGNFLGTSQNGTAAEGNSVGVLITSKSSLNQIGSGNRADLNVISGNTFDGVRVEAQANGNVIVGNFIGTDQNGVNPLGNVRFGVSVESGAINTRVGGLGAGTGNVIALNGASGVRITDAATSGTSVLGNRIGLDFAGSNSPNGGDGVRVENAAGTAPAGGLLPPDTNTLIRTNRIVANKGNGISVLDTSRFVRIDDNSISMNDGLGIRVDPSASDGLTPPVLTSSVTQSGGGQKVSGSLSGRPNTLYDVRFFANGVADPSGSGEGETVAGSTTATTDASGAATFSFVIPSTTSGSVYSATATANLSGDTSAFSNIVSRQQGALTARVVVVGVGSGTPFANLYDSDGTPAATLNSTFAANATGGVRVASGDFNGDGIPDIVIGTGPGVATRVRIIDPTTQKELFSVQPFEAAFTGGVYVAVGDVTGDGKADLIITPDEGGGPRVRVFNGQGFGVVDDFFGIDDTNFRGGARAAVGDVNGDGVGDLIVAAGFGGGPRIAGFSGKSIGTPNRVKLFNDFFAFEQTLRNGTFVAAADVNGDGKADLVVGGGPGGGPRVLVLSGTDLVNSNSQVAIANFFAGSDSNRGGVRVAARNLDGDGKAEVITGDGPGGEGKVRIYSGSSLSAGTPNALTTITDASVKDGVFVG